jgi:hypothetical protein
MFKAGNNYGKFSKRGKSVDTEFKEKIKELANGLLEEIDIKDLSKTQRINLLKVCVPYLIPRETPNLKGLAEDLPLFVDNEPPKVIVFRDAKELEEYNSMTEEEQNALDDKKKPTIKNFFNSGGEA